MTCDITIVYSTGCLSIKDQVISDLQAKVDILETKFQVLANHTLECLLDSGVSVSMFYAIASNKPKSVAGKCLKECFRLFGLISSLESLWGKLNRLWNFFNYELLQHIIRVIITVADDPLLSQLAEYEDEIGRFLSSTKLSDFFKVWPFSIDRPQENEVVELRRVIMKIDRNWEDCTLRDVKSVSNTFAQGFFLPHEFLLLAGVGKSSITLLWYVPPSLASSIEEKVTNTSDFLSENGFLMIIIDDLQVYPLTPMRQCSLHLQKMYVFNACHRAKKSAEKLMPFKLVLITKESGASDKPTTITTLGTLPDGSPARLVLLEGAPGSGKTTFSFDAVLKWLRKETLTDILLLALFPLRDYNLRKVTNLLELLALITPGYESLMEELEANKGEGMTFWLDGWDEIASSLDGDSSIYEQLVSGKILPKARVIVTSRPWATDYIKRQLDNQPSQHIELISSHHDQIHWLIELKRQELPAKFLSIIGDFLKYLEETPAIQGYMLTPLATEITLEVYKWSQESSSPLPTTVTQLYTSYTCLCIHKYLDNHSHFEPKMWKSNNFRDLPEPLRSWFFSLCRLAFDGLLDGQRLVFPDVPNHLRLETLGLMQAQAPLYASEESAVVSYHYKHLTFQEFLSALLVSWMSDEERREIVERCVSDGHYTMVLRFLSGLIKSPIISVAKIRGILNDIQETSDIFHWSHESDPSLIASFLGEKELRVSSNCSWSALDYFVTGHTTVHSSCPWNINFSNSDMGDTELTWYLQGLREEDLVNNKRSAFFISASLSHNKITYQSLSHLADVPSYLLRNLKHFDIGSNELDCFAVEHIAKQLVRMPALESLDLSNNPNIKDRGAHALRLATRDHKNLKQLYLLDNGIDGTMQLEYFLSVTGNMKCIERYPNLHTSTLAVVKSQGDTFVPLDSSTTNSQFHVNRHANKLPKKLKPVQCHRTQKIPHPIDSQLNYIEVLKKRTGINDTQLDTEIIIHDLHILAGCFDNYKDYLDKLRLTRAECADVKSVEYREGHQSAMREALRYWVSKNHGAATYRALLELTIQLKKVTAAKSLGEYISHLFSVDRDAIISSQEVWNIKYRQLVKKEKKAFQDQSTKKRFAYKMRSFAVEQHDRYNCICRLKQKKVTGITKKDVGYVYKLTKKVVKKANAVIAEARNLDV